MLDGLQKFPAPMPPAPVPLALTGWATLLSHPVPFLLLPAFVAYMNRLHISPEAGTWSATFGDEEDTYQHAVATRLT